MRCRVNSKIANYNKVRNKMIKQFPKATFENIPGTTQMKSEYAKDLKTLRYCELLEIRDRQANLLVSK